MDHIPQDTFTGKGSEMLQVLHFNDFKSVLLETKASHEIFEEYDSHLMLIKLCVWNDEIESKEPIKIFLRDDKTVSQLMDVIA